MIIDVDNLFTAVGILFVQLVFLFDPKTDLVHQ